jgi:hypothetical protein
MSETDSDELPNASRGGNHRANWGPYLKKIVELGAPTGRKGRSSMLKKLGLSEDPAFTSTKLGEKIRAMKAANMFSKDFKWPVQRNSNDLYI